jgi:Na+/melibiose symporter-like transporter
MFVNPGFDTQNKSIWLYVFVAAVYVIWGMVYTASDVPFWSMPNVMTPNPKERGNIISYAKTVGGIGSAVTVALPIIVGFIVADMDVEKANIVKYAIMAVSMSLIGMPLFVRSSFGVKERIEMPNATKRAPGEPSSLKRIFTCKPLVLVVVSGVLSFGRYMLQAAAPHVARYSGFYLGSKAPQTVEEINKNISNVALVIQVCAAIGMFGAMLVLPKLYKKFEYKHIMIVSCLGGFVATCLTLIVGWTTKNLLICIPFMLISAIPLGVINVVSYAMICDSLDYMELTTGHRENGLGSACQGFINKIGNAFATSGIIVLYMVIGMDPKNMLSSEAVKFAFEVPMDQRFSMFLLVSLIPGISMLLCSIPMFFYKIAGKEKEKMLEELKVKREKEGFTVAE